MIEKKMTFISAQPDVQYFHWQVEVFIHNAMKNGINPNWIEIIFSYDGQISKEGSDLASRYPFVRFFFYERQKEPDFGYIPLLRPHILEQHFLKYPQLSSETIFYHDSDIIFRELPDFNSMLKDDTWYLSDTISYIGSDYIKSKSDQLLSDMCHIAGISRDLVESNNQNSGGAQYLMKNIDHNFWADVKKVSLDLYKYMSGREIAERKNLASHDVQSYNPIQKWCADMWAVLWCGLKRGNDIRISDELSFSWGSSYGKEQWEKHKIMHNAGVTSDNNGSNFYKAKYINSAPWDDDFSLIDPDCNGYNYVQAILYAKERRNLL